MPTTSTAVNGKNCAIRLDNESGVLTDISGSANEVTVKRNRQIGDYNAFGDNETYRTIGVRDATVDVTLIFSKGGGESLRLLKAWDNEANGSYRTLQFDVVGALPGTTSPIDRWSGEVVLESFEIPAKVDEAKPIMVKCSLKVHGDLAWSEV